MILHRPPEPTGPGRYMAATILLFPLWLIALGLVAEPSVRGPGAALIISFVLSPPLGVLLWQSAAQRQYTKEKQRRRRPRGREERRRPGDEGSPVGFSRQEDAAFSSIVLGEDAPGPRPDEIRLACLRRPGGASLLGHPLMILQCLCAVVEIVLVLRGQMYTQCLALPAAIVLTSVTLVWFVVGGPAWSLLEIKGGEAWIGEVESSSRPGHGPERIIAAGPTDDGIQVTVESQNDIRLWFPGGSLPVGLQRDIALDALETHGGVMVSTAGLDMDAVSYDEELS